MPVSTASPLSDSDTAREYSAAFYLLISTGGELVGDSSQSPAHWWSGFEADLGKAAMGPYVWPNLWRRDFAAGVALVNPPAADAVVVTLPAPFARVDGSIVNSIRLGAGEGAVLKSAAAASDFSAFDCNSVVLPGGGSPTCTANPADATPPAGTAVTIPSHSNVVLRVPPSVGEADVVPFSGRPGAVRGRPAPIFAQMGSTSAGETSVDPPPVGWPVYQTGAAPP